MGAGLQLCRVVGRGIRFEVIVECITGSVVVDVEVVGIFEAIAGAQGHKEVAAVGVAQFNAVDAARGAPLLVLAMEFIGVGVRSIVGAQDGGAVGVEQL